METETNNLKKTVLKMQRQRVTFVWSRFLIYIALRSKKNVSNEKILFGAGILSARLVEQILAEKESALYEVFKLSFGIVSGMVALNSGMIK